MQGFMGFLVQDILGQAPLLVGLVALVGLLLQRKPATEVLSGTVKTIVGFLVFNGGASVGVAALSNFQELFMKGFHVKGVLPLNEAITALALGQLAQVTSLIMVFGFVVNLIVARLTPLKFIFLTGQHNLFFAAMLAVVMHAANLSPMASVAVGSAILGFSAAFFPWLGQPTMRRITGGDEIAIGHYDTIGYALAGWIGSKVGRPEESTEKLKLPPSLSFFRDYVMSISATVLIMYYVAALAAGREAVEAIAGSTHWLVFPLMQALTFTAAVFIIITGIRLLLSEIVPAFVGISQRLIPEARPALDCPAVFPYAPTAVILGFLSAYAAGLIWMAVFAAAHMTVIIPVAIPYFFIGATAGVFGNATGGWKGAVVGAFAVGSLIAIGPALIYPIMEKIGLSGTTFSDTEFTSIGYILYHALQLLR